MADRRLTLPGVDVKGPRGSAPAGDSVGEDYILTRPGTKANIGLEGKTGVGPASRAIKNRKDQLEQQMRDLGI